MQRPRLILIGGFLGAGKTTLMARAAARLVAKGLKVGLVTNDQAAGLVDTEIARRISSNVREVAGGCFCCKFGDLVAALKQIFREITPDVILAEPVGSCTDLSATVLQPFKDLYAEMLHVAPFSVLADPARLREALAAGDHGLMPESVRYIFRKQLEEADLIVVNKLDLLAPGEPEEIEKLIGGCFPGSAVIFVSALEDRGVDAWLDRVLADDRAGSHVVAVDYDLYARGEAELGWLNATVELRAAPGTDLAAYCRRLLASLRDDLRARSADIAHLKILVGDSGSTLTANVTGLRDEPRVLGALAAGTAPLRMLVNARVHLPPEALRALVEQTLAGAGGASVTARVLSIESFRPGRPQPTHRYSSVVPER